MNFRKGMKIHFISSDRDEIIERGSSNPFTGIVITNKEEYSFDFIFRWLHMGFVKVYNKSGKEIIIK